MRPLVLILLLGLGAPSFADEAPLHITAGEWAKPRAGIELVRFPGLAAAVRGLLAAPASRLELRYPGGDEGSLWAGELRAWLVALGIPSVRIELVPGSSVPGQIDIQLVPQQVQGVVRDRYSNPSREG